MSIQTNMAFIQQVMAALGNTQFQSFIEVLKNFRDGRISHNQIQRYVQVLFFHHPHLYNQPLSCMWRKAHERAAGSTH